MEIAPEIYHLKVPIPDNPLGHVNCYLVEGRDGWLMVDTGWFTPDAFSSLEAGLRGLGLALADIATIIVTHVHPDHFGLAGRIKYISPRAELLTCLRFVGTRDFGTLRRGAVALSAGSVIPTQLDSRRRRRYDRT